MKKGDKIKVTLPFGKFNYIEDKLIRIAIEYLSLYSVNPKPN